MFVIRLIGKIAALPLIVLTAIAGFLFNLATDLSGYVIGPALLLILGFDIYFLITTQWILLRRPVWPDRGHRCTGRSERRSDPFHEIINIRILKNLTGTVYGRRCCGQSPYFCAWRKKWQRQD